MDYSKLNSLKDQLKQATSAFQVMRLSEEIEQEEQRIREAEEREDRQRAELMSSVESIKQLMMSPSQDLTESKKNRKIKDKRKTIEQMLTEDIERCKLFLAHPDDLAEGRQIYIEITGRYDSIISSFGNGLYSYFADHHFYDPEIGKESLVHNLTVLLNKMVTYQAVHYPILNDEPVNEKTNITSSKKVFIVHGHDNEAVQEMARALEKGGFEPIVLHEQPDGGMTIIEKIEKYSDVGYAVVLYTACDIGRDKTASCNQEKNRARQNVVFEHGFLIGKLGRNHVSALVKGDIETPGDISGVVYISMDANGAWKMHLAKNMQNIGLPVDMNTFCR